MNATEPFHYSFEFRGQLGEFWRLWWRDILRCVVTLGFYIPWAQINIRRYFYRNTWLNGEAFDYTVDPVVILRGRALSLGLLAGCGISAYHHAWGMLAISTFLLVMLWPWLLLQSRRYTLRHTVYRGVHFDCDANYWQILTWWLMGGLLVLASAGLAYPYWSCWQHRLFIDASCYGTSYFEFDAALGKFYRTASNIFFATVLVTLTMFGIYHISPFFVDQPTYFEHFESAYFLLTLLLPLGMIVCAVARAHNDQLLARHIQLHTHRFYSTITAPELAWVYFSNTLLVMFTCGLLLPWAIYRAQAYRITCLRLCPDGDWEAFITAEQERAEAIGEEFQTYSGMEIAL